MSASRSSTYFLSIITVFPRFVSASNEISSISFSITVVSRRAPMFSVVWFSS